MKNAVIVKSFRNGLTLYLDSDLDFGQLLEEVAGKFNESKEFFSDASVAVSFEGRELSFEEEMEKAAEALYGKYVPAGVREFIEMSAGSKPAARPKKPKISSSSAVGAAPAPGGDSD